MRVLVVSPQGVMVDCDAEVAERLLVAGFRRPADRGETTSTLAAVEVTVVPAAKPARKTPARKRTAKGVRR